MESDQTETSDQNMITEPLLLSNSNGGFRTLPFIVANMAFERVASYGLLPNMILYLTREYRIEVSKGANILFFWSATTNFMPILGAFLADSYVGRFWMISFGSLATLLGTILLWLTTMIPQARPPHCGQYSDDCQSATTSQFLLLYSSFGLLSIGAGGIRSSSLAFGADQLGMGNHDLKNAGILESFISWYYVFVSFSAVIAITFIVYIQDELGWKVGFGIPVVLMTISAISFFLASPIYVKSRPEASLFTKFAQVFAAAYKNRGVLLSSRATDEEYFSRKGASLLAPSHKLRFLNKACIIENPEEDLTPDGRASDPWKLCTVDQVEELKALIKIIPLWSSGMIMSINLAQSSFPVLQASTMDRHITSNFEIPAGSFSVFMVISLAIWVTLYDRLIIPLASKLKGKPIRLSLKKRMGIGILLSSSSMAAFAIIEKNRREKAIKQGFSDDPDAIVDMSAMWLLPYHVLGGLAEAFNAIGQNEFYYTELPRSMASIASTLFDMGMSIANLIASLLMSSINNLSKREGEESWVSSNINKGHYDYYYWLLACLSLLNFVYFVACSKGYGPYRREWVTS
ncbi:protein NRT1/ PTR FAMILY 1.2-like [Mercurialis annua]|uniref:protein NRT1/ PTR FAMILY 1.2-like n=1 Tax=Mercurialis annua TaxID=3986 RepID=UPI0021609456|nr:protein NRT1/ PTR FAMILY 1.2-like [Mercurialis annua]